MAHDPEQVQMSFGEHLEELRKRLIRALIGVAVACCATFYFAQDLVAWLAAPLAYAYSRAGLPPQIVQHKVMTAFTLYMKVGLIAGAILAGPWVLYQLWQFVAAGLYAAERRVVLLLAPFSALMTLLGVLFAYYILLPLALVFLIGFSTTYALPGGQTPPIERVMRTMPGWTHGLIDWINGVPAPPATQQSQGDSAETPRPRFPVLDEDPPHPLEGEAWINPGADELRVQLAGRVRIVRLGLATLINPMIEVDDYVDFVAFMMLGIVVAFQVPVVMLVMGWTRLIEPQAVARSRKYYVFLCFVAAAFLTPTADPFNMCLLAFPLWGLFELGLVVMRLAHRRQPAA
jgi:sec-independent protein translocase protein TatC